MTEVAAAVAPIALDAVDLGFTPVLLEDATVYAETLAVDGALNQASPHLQRLRRTSFKRTRTRRSSCHAPRDPM